MIAPEAASFSLTVSSEGCYIAMSIMYELALREDS